MFQGKRIGVLGWARSGASVSRLLKSRGAHVFVSDKKTAEQLGAKAVEELRALGVPYELGGHSERVREQDLIVLSPGIPPEIPILREIGIPVLSEIEVAYRELRAPMVAVTGTNGKTTTCTALAEVLEGAGRTVHLVGNVGRPLSEAALTAKETDIVVCEVSSFQLETIEEFRPRISVLTNLRPDHLDRYPGFEEYRIAKERIFLNQTEEETAILNLDDPVSREIAEALLPRVVGLSSRESVPGGVYMKGDSVLASLRSPEEETVIVDDVSAALLEFKAPENLLAVCAAGLLLGLTPKEITKGVKAFKGLRHRIELAAEWNGIRFYNDSKATNVAAVLSALERFPDSSVILLMGGKDKGEDYRELIPLLKEKVSELKVFGEAGRTIENTLHGVVPTAIYASLDDAVIAAFNAAQDGKTVLLSPACSSYDAFKNFEERGDYFIRLVKDRITLMNTKEGKRN